MRCCRIILWCCCWWVFFRILHTYGQKEVMFEIRILLIGTNICLLISRSLGLTHEQCVVLSWWWLAILLHSLCLLEHRRLRCIDIFCCLVARAKSRRWCSRSSSISGEECVEICSGCVHLEYKWLFLWVIVCCVVISIWIRVFFVI